MRDDGSSFTALPHLQNRLATAFSVLNHWNAALAAQEPLEDALTALKDHVGADYCALSRLRDAWDAPRVAAQADGEMKDRNVSHAMIRLIRGKYAKSAVPGSIWRLSELRDEPGFATSELARLADQMSSIREVSVMILTHSKTQIDFLHVKFRNAPSRDMFISAETLGNALLDAWDRRMPGRIGRLIVEMQRRFRPETPAPKAAILSAENPYGLSRSEFRVCHLIGLGLKACQIAGELGLSEATVRSHLRGIYAKTNTSGQVDVIARLHAAPQDLPLQQASGF